jgi:hypothetical protein
MHHARRLIATVTTLTIWCVASATVAYAKLPPDPVGGGGVGSPPPIHPASDSAVGKFVLVAALVALLTVAIVALIASLRHARPSRPTRMLHA